VLNATSALSTQQLAWAVFFVATGLLGYEISLMRMLLVASWSHFAFLVISMALLGFGTSGTVLCLFRHRLLPHCRAVMLGLVLASAVLIPVCASLAQHVPIETRFVPSLLGRQISSWLVFWVVLGMPFLTGAAAIGFALMVAREHIALVYASNLMGSGLGCILATVAMTFFLPEWLPTLMGIVTLLAVIGMGFKARTTHLSVLSFVVIVGGQAWFAPPRLRIDPYKYLAYVQRLVNQHAAEQVATAVSPRSTIGVYRSDLFHDMPFLGAATTPPPMLNLVIDGHLAGSLLQANDAEEARILDETLMAFPYTQLSSKPRVLLLGEKDGINIWLALRHQATHIAVVQPDRKLIDLLRGRLHDEGGAVFGLDTVSIAPTEPRHFVEHTSQLFDLIQLVTLQGLPAGSGGMTGLAEDYLTTVEGMTACLRRLTAHGMLVVCRGIQTPPRDNIKLIATFVEAMKRIGLNDPARHIAIVRDYLGVCTMVTLSPWETQQANQLRYAFAQKQLTPVWFPGIQPKELNHPDRLPGPNGDSGDWYYHAVTRLFSPQASDFINEYVYDIRPATDDRPFFLDFCKLRSLRALYDAFGELWLTRTELAFLFVLATIVLVALAGIILTLLPLVTLGDVRHTTGQGVTFVYFTSIGLAYMLLEMTLLSRMTHLLGDPVWAAALTISSFLLLSGLGSLCAQSVKARKTHWLLVIFAGLVLVAGIEILILNRAATWMGSFSLVTRCAAAVGAIAPLAVLMGFPMPIALARLARGAAPLVPWAWGTNGFASVLAPPLAVMIGMNWGYTTAAVGAVFLYALSGAILAKLPDARHNFDRPERL